MDTPINVIQTLAPIFDQELTNACRGLKAMVLSQDGEEFKDFSNLENVLKNVLNQVIPDKECVGVVITENIDNIPFGIYVNPTITDSDLLGILLTPDPIELTRYGVEIDTKLYTDYDLEPAELAAYLVEDISTIMVAGVGRARAILDGILAESDESLDIRQSVNYSQILSFGVKDAMEKRCSFLYKPEDEIGIGKYAVGLDLHNLLYSCSGKLRNLVFGSDNAPEEPKLSTLRWCLMVYKEVSLNYRMSIEILQKAKVCTGSELLKKEINKTIAAINRAVNEIVTEAASTESLCEAKGMSLFSSMKKNGLRSIEDDLYEYKIRLKTCETEEEAMYILRQVNTRISILEDYVDNTDLNDAERKRWLNVINSYRLLREDVGKKNIAHQKTYGVFVDYDKLDQLD